MGTTLRIACLLLATAFAACHHDPQVTNPPVDSTVAEPKDLTILGLGAVTDRYTGEVWVQGNTAYTSTWGLRSLAYGDVIKVWDVSGATPVFVDSAPVNAAGTLGDVQVSDDARLLAVAIEPRPNGGLALFSLDDPRHPRLLIRYSSPNTALGVHTAEIARVNGTLYAFCAIDPGNGVAAKLVTLDLTNPLVPVEVSVVTLGNPYIHDVFVRDGILFTAEWDNGVGIWDIGASSGTPANPRKLGQVHTVGGEVHNIWWFHDPTTGSKKYLFAGQEGPGQIGLTSYGDVHVVDVSDFTAPREVAVFSVPGAGTHNFSMDEANGFLYAAFYNAGIQVLDVRGDLGNCTAAQRTSDGRCFLTSMGRLKYRFTKPASTAATYMWGVQYVNGVVYGSDMLNGLWKISPATR